MIKHYYLFLVQKSLESNFLSTDKLTEENKIEMPFTLSLHSTLGVKIL